MRKGWMVLSIMVLVATVAGVLWMAGAFGGGLSSKDTGSNDYDTEVSEKDRGERTSGSGETDESTETSKASIEGAETEKDAGSEGTKGSSENKEPKETSGTKEANESEKTVSNEVDSSTQGVHVRAQEDVWDEMHQMVNTKIIADEIWGTIEITADRVDSLIAEVSQSGFDDKEVLLAILENWKKGDFSHAVEEHNYLWEQLGGTVGRATGLKE